MPEGADLALAIRGIVAIVLAVGALLQIASGFLVLIIKKQAVRTATSFDMSWGKGKVAFSTGAAGVAVVLSAVVTVLGSVAALPRFSQTPQGTEVTMGLPLLTLPFTSTTADLTDAQRKVLDGAADFLRSESKVGTLRVEGLTSRDDAFGQALADRRANTVRQYLISTHGIPPDKLEARGVGETSPQMPITTYDAVAIVKGGGGA